MLGMLRQDRGERAWDEVAKPGQVRRSIESVATARLEIAVWGSGPNLEGGEFWNLFDSQPRESNAETPTANFTESTSVFSRNFFKYL